MNGFKINITESDIDLEKTKHFSGYHEKHSGAVYCECPNCANQMFPALNIDGKDPGIKKLNLWQECYLNILFCPFCSFYMEPYWEIYTNDKIIIIGGDHKSKDILQNIETPYIAREITLKALQNEDDPDNEKVLIKYKNRTKDEGVYHQIGGKPIQASSAQMQCPKCKNNMTFSGILDYDDLNIPLYEDNHRPVSLIIGDEDCLNIYTCKNCLVIGLEWVY